MQYRKFGNTGVEVSALGFGAMRLPLLNQEDKQSIDEAAAIQMIRHSIDSGVNYVDTAYPYHGGMSEIVVGKALKDGYREKTMLATKCPLWNIEKEEDFERILDEQLEKLDTTYIDFYMLHAINKERFQEKVCKFNLIKHMAKAKAGGKIKFIGFSFHDDYETFPQVVDSYDWDFCQIQYNYINIDYQAGKKGLQYAAQKGLGVVIMEPLLGGKLAEPPQNVKQALSPDKTPVKWAFDFLWNQPEVSLLLSGMSTMQQVEENLTYASTSAIGVLDKTEEKMFLEAKRIFDTMALVGCTKCAYCIPCPFGLNIPELFTAYNMTASHNVKQAKAHYDSLEKKASDCKTCRHCEEECPQNIKISSIMTNVAKKFALQ